MPGGHDAKEDGALDKLRMLRVAKDLFLSEWYRESCAQLRFSAHACGVLDTVAEESREEREEAMSLIARWVDRLRDERVADGTRYVARAARRDFILNLIEVKEEAGKVFERAAMVAPSDMREDFERLAATDFRHALDLRKLLVDELQTEWRERTGRAPD